MRLLAEYEALQELGRLTQHKTAMLGTPVVIPKHQLRSWLASRVASGKVTRADQLLWLQSMFPEVPTRYLEGVAGQDITSECLGLNGVQDCSKDNPVGQELHSPNVRAASHSGPEIPY